MIPVLRRILKDIPTFLLAFILALVVWVSAVTAADPNQEQPYTHPVPIEVIGQDPALILTNSIPSSVTVTLKAPKSIWVQMATENNPVTAMIDLSNLASGTHEVPIQIHFTDRPVELISSNPSTVQVTLETLATKNFTVDLTVLGEPAVGYQAGAMTMSSNTISVSGAQSQVKRVSEVRASINISQAQQDIHQPIDLQALDANGQAVSGVTLAPDQVTVNIPITQKGGYRNVVIKVVTKGQITSGYRLTNITAYPPSVTLFSSDPQAIENLPGYVETNPVDINNAKSDLYVQATLNLPSGVSVVGNQSVVVYVGVAAIQGSLTLSNMPVQITGLGSGLAVSLSPDHVDVILTGPLYLLDQLSSTQVTVVVDLTNQGAGVIKLAPKVNVAPMDIHAESVLPGTIEVNIVETTPTPTPTATPTLRPGLSPRITPTPTFTPAP